MRKFIINCFELGTTVYFIADDRICASEIHHVRVYISKSEENIYYYIDNYDGEKVYKLSLFVYPTIELLLKGLKSGYEIDL